MVEATMRIFAAVHVNKILNLNLSLNLNVINILLTLICILLCMYNFNEIYFVKNILYSVIILTTISGGCLDAAAAVKVAEDAVQSMTCTRGLPAAAAADVAKGKPGTQSVVDYIKCTRAIEKGAKQPNFVVAMQAEIKKSPRLAAVTKR